MIVRTDLAILVCAARQMALPRGAFVLTYFTTDECKEFDFLWNLPFSQVKNIASLGPCKTHEVSND